MLLQITLVLAIIFLVPMLSRKVHIPAIVGFIVTGMLIGPFGLNLLTSTTTIDTLGKMGILYIMFQAGSEIDFNEMKEHRTKAIFFGVYSFLMPALIGFLVSFFVLRFSAITSTLLASMFGSHTLMTYPIVTRYGIQKTRSVNIVVGATSIAITLALLLLAWVKGHVLDTTHWYTILLIFLSPYLILGVFPKVAQWFLKKHTEPVADFMLIMFLLVISAYLTEAAGLDGILGAFLCGIALNRLLPSRAPLTGRVTFVGNSLFVPLFLISVGLLIDVRVFWSGWSAILIALAMIFVKLSGKWLAVWFAQRQWQLTKTERQLMFGLTHATAAGTLAIVSIGYSIGVFTSEILNASVLMILVLCTLSSFCTEYAAKQMALQEDANVEVAKDSENWRIFSMGDSDKAIKTLATAAQLHNVNYSIQETWQSVYQIMEMESCSMAVYEERQPLNTLSRILVAVPRYAEKERDFLTCFGLIRRLSSEIGAKVIFYSNSDTEKILRRMCQRPGKTLNAGFRELDNWEDILLISKDMRENDMLVLQSSRKSTASYNPLFQEIPNILTRFFQQSSYLVLVPEQQTGGIDIDTFLMDIPQTSQTWSLVSKVKQWLLRQLRHLQGPVG